MKIAVYTMTRDRLEYTKRSFTALKLRAGRQYDHYVLDNGSKDGTASWLQENATEFKWLKLESENTGISKGSNTCIEAIRNSGENYDIIIKMDNDCEVLSDNILVEVENIMTGDTLPFGSNYILSPVVTGINNPPAVDHVKKVAGYRVGMTAIVGGLFMITSAKTLYSFPGFDPTLPKAKGQDDQFCHWFKINGGEVGYIEALSVYHIDGTDGQCAKFPEYFTRKWEEEKR